MITTFKEYLLFVLIEGMRYNSYLNVAISGLNGMLIIQPEYQRHYIYNLLKLDVLVIESLLKGYDLGIITIVKRSDGMYEVLDGQQRLTTIGRYVLGLFAVKDQNGMPQYFSSLPKEKQDKILNTTIMVREISNGTEQEIKDLYKMTNIGGVSHVEQEIRNAVYSGPFVNALKEEFSNDNNANVNKWKHYIDAVLLRQGYLEKALCWAANGKDNIDEYMSKNRLEENIDEVKEKFNQIIDWAKKLFPNLRQEMKYVDWGRLYNEYHANTYNVKSLNSRIDELFEDDTVQRKKNIYEYALGGSLDSKILDIRFFDEATKKKVYATQTEFAKQEKKSNCSVCASVNNNNKTKIWSIKEMDADHVTAWSKGGETKISNCEMLCKSHNRAKGNK